MTRAFIQKTGFDGRQRFLVNTYGYGPAWSMDRASAWMFVSIASAQRHIESQQLHNAYVVRR